MSVNRWCPLGPLLGSAPSTAWLGLCDTPVVKSALVECRGPIRTESRTTSLRLAHTRYLSEMGGTAASPIRREDGIDRTVALASLARRASDAEVPARDAGFQKEE